MTKTEHPLQALASFIPPGTFLGVAAYLTKYKVHLILTRDRQSVLGNYRNAFHNNNHRITINKNLNTYSFLLTLLHELAHLLTYEQYGHTVNPHGKEWKNNFGLLLQQFLTGDVFPADIKQEVLKTLHNPGASSCAEEGLMRVLRRYDKKQDGQVLVEDVPAGMLFKIKDGRIFRKGEKLRKRYRCQEVGTNRMYLFSGIYEVFLVRDNASIN